MSETLAVLDYRAGNLRSVETALRCLGARFVVSDRPEDLAAARRLIIPGVGQARTAMEELRRRGLQEAIREHFAAGRPLLGICLGCQIIFESSQERSTTCLGLLPGTVRRFAASPDLKVPHMGWNRVFRRRAHHLFHGIDDGAWFYFLHSYYPDPGDEQLALAHCEYGLRFAAAVGRDNLVACQFHPEKSGPAGLSLLANFLSWEP